MIDKFPSFKRRMNWFIENRHDVAERNIASMKQRGKGDRVLLSLVSKERLVKILRRMLDETEFLSEHGIRSLSKHHEKHPYSMEVNGQKFEVAYLSGESDSGLFGGNSNWRGPIWLCVNFLLVESLLRFYMFYGKSLQIECPTGSGEYMHLGHVAEELQHRLQHLFARGDDGKRAVNNGNDMLDFDPHWKDYLWFYEYFDGDSGRGLGASHQCGWSGLVAKMIHDTGYFQSAFSISTQLTPFAVSIVVCHRPHERRRWQQHTTSMMFSPSLPAACLESDVRQHRDRLVTAVASTHQQMVKVMERKTSIRKMTKRRDEKAKQINMSRSMLPTSLSAFRATNRSSMRMNLRHN